MAARGGFAQGSGSFVIYDGANLARKRDVVVVTLNHRLNVFGFLYLAELGGDKWANAGNVGMQDVVLALQWVRDNIAAFGGDPGNVTIFGQSGGGGKVCALLAMPSAKGLFHKAVAQSGSFVNGALKADATKSAEALVTRLGLKPNQLDELQKLPVDQILTAMAPLAGQGGRGGGRGRGGQSGQGGGGLNFGPVIDGKTIPVAPFDPVATAISANIPLLCGSTETEVTFTRGTPLEDMDDQTLRDRMKQLLRTDDAEADKLIAAYRKGRPGVSNIDVYLIAASDNSFREGVLTVAERKGRSEAGAGLHVLPHVAVAGARRQAEGLPHARHPVHLRERRSGDGDDRRQPVALCAAGSDERGLGDVRAHGKSQRQRVFPSGRCSTAPGGRRCFWMTSARSSTTRTATSAWR